MVWISRATELLLETAAWEAVEWADEPIWETGPLETRPPVQLI